MVEDMVKQGLPISSVNGEMDSALNLEDRGLAYGDGLFETMRVERGRIDLLDRHLSRLRLGCQRLSMPYNDQRVRNYLDDLLRCTLTASTRTEDGVGIVKLIYTRGIGGQGYTPPSFIQSFPNIILQFKHRPFASGVGAKGVDLYVCETSLPLNPTLAGLKHLNRLQYVLAAQQVPAGENNHGLLLDGNGCVIETLHHNLFLVKDNTLFTPKLSQCGVAGVMRAFILEELALLLTPQMNVVESDFGLKELYGADEIFISNSVRGVWHVSSLRGSCWEKGPVVTQLQKQLDAFWSGSHDLC